MGTWFFTQDLDFGVLLAAQNAARPSVLQIRTQDVLPVAIGNTVLAAIRSTETELAAGA